MKLTRLKIDKYRRVLPGTELFFDDGLNVLLGRNGTGKTTLLKLLSMCARSEFETLAQEEFSFDYDLRSDELLVHVHVENRKREILPTSAVSMDELQILARSADERFEYEVIVELRLKSTRKSYRVRATPSSSQLEEVGNPKSTRVIEALSPFTKGSISLAILNLYQPLISDEPLVAANPAFLDLLMAVLGSRVYRFDESLAAFRAMEGRLTDEAGSAPPISLLKLQRGPGAKFTSIPSHFVPRSVPTLVEELVNGPEKVTDISLRHDALGFLSRFVDTVGLSSAEMKVSLLKKEVDGQDEQLIVGDFKFLLYFKDGTVISHDLLSYGQKRLLSFLYYVDCTPHVVVADEIVNGLHHEWIDACLDAIGERQAFLTSQNPLLLDYLSFESADQAEKCFIVCRTELHNGREHMRWANITKGEAEAFYRGYLAGIQHVSELLRTEGLW